MDAPAEVNHICQVNGYTLTKAIGEGPEGFICTITIDGTTVMGEGRSKKDAYRDACEVFLGSNPIYFVDGDNSAHLLKVLKDRGVSKEHVLVFGSKLASFPTYDYTFIPSQTCVKDSADVQLIIHLSRFRALGNTQPVMIVSRDAIFEEVSASLENVSQITSL